MRTNHGETFSKEPAVLHTVFIGLHAAAGLVALIAGAAALRGGRLFLVYLWSMVAMMVFLVLAVAMNWDQDDTALRVLFAALIGLGAVMVGRAWLAGRARPVGPAGPTGGYLRHIGFTLIGLCDAFVVITVLNAGTPVWTIVAAAAVVAVVGHFALATVRRRILAATIRPSGS